MTAPLPEPDEPLAAGPAAPRRTAVVVLAVLAVLLLAADAALAVVWLARRSDRQQLDAARTDAVVAARQEILNLDSLSAATIDHDLATVLAGATGTFKDQFSRSQADLKALIVQRQTKSTAQILSAGVVRSDAGSATVLVAADRTVSDTTTPAGQVAHDRWSVDLEKHGGRWLVANLQPVA